MKAGTARIVRVTPFPNVLLDTVMPALKDTQWRVLCVIVRQTLGWQKSQYDALHRLPTGVATTGAVRKGRDWLTHSQLKARTGRNSEAICRAIDALIRQDLISVWDEKGQVLATARTRQRGSGRLFFGLSPHFLAQLNLFEQLEPETITKSEKGFTKSEFRKAKTTKETLTKTPKGNVQKPPLIHSPVDNHSFQRKKREEPNPEVKRFLHSYITLFQERTMNGERPVIAWGKDSKIVKHLLALYPYLRLVELLYQFFASKDQWIRESGYSIGAFRAAINKLLTQERAKGGSHPVSPSRRTG